MPYQTKFAHSILPFVLCTKCSILLIPPFPLSKGCFKGCGFETADFLLLYVQYVQLPQVHFFLFYSFLHFVQFLALGRNKSTTIASEKQNTDKI